MSYDLATKQVRRPPRGRSLLGDIALMVRAELEALEGSAWPSPAWQSDPVGFARTILGVEPWERQVEILEAIRDHKRVAVSSGRKCGKDFVVALAALWWFGSFPDARVIMTATRAKQIDDVLFRDVRRLFHGSGKCLRCRKTHPEAPRPCPHSAKLSGQVHELARSGIKSPDLREITGHTAETPEGMAGTSGSRLLYILDEASGIPDDIHAAIRGNLASGESREVLISNPTRSKGFFHRAFHEARDLYRTITISSEETPNVVQRRELFPGLASADWIDEQRREWGGDSPLYRIHVLGQFVEQEQGRLFTVHALGESEARWDETPATGRLVIGVDPAGPSGEGDESAFAVRRGKKITTLYARRGLTEEAHLVEVLGIIRTARRDREEPPIVVVDRDGSVGAKVWGVLVAHKHRHDDAFELVGVRGGERAQRQPQTYDRVRDELFAALVDWLNDGGALPSDQKLEAELAEFQWIDTVSGRAKLTDKRELRKALGRSPDRADALALSVWARESHWQELPTTGGDGTLADDDEGIDPYGQAPDRVFDPYANRGTW